MSKKRNPETEGNAIASMAAFQKAMYDKGALLERSERIFERLDDRNILVTRLTIRLPTQGMEEYLAIVAAEQDGVAVVAFHRGTSFPEALLGILRRLENGSVIWKEDRYANEG